MCEKCVYLCQSCDRQVSEPPLRLVQSLYLLSIPPKLSLEDSATWKKRWQQHTQLHKTEEGVYMKLYMISVIYIYIKKNVLKMSDVLPIRGHLWDLDGRMSFRISKSTEIPSSTVTLKHNFSPLSGMKKEARSKTRKNNIGSWKLMKCIRGILLSEI